MSSETDHPRQRTVAELLAAHGDGTASGRRARRRAAENAGQGAPGAASGGYPAAGANGAPPQASEASGPPSGNGAPGPSAAAGPGSGGFPAVGGGPAPNSGALPAVGGPPAGPASGPFPAVGGASPAQAGGPSAAPHSGPFPVVGGSEAAPTSGSFPAVDGPGPAWGSAEPGANGRAAPPNGASGAVGRGADDAGAAGGGAAGWGPGDGPPNGAPRPGRWSTGDGPPGAANGGPEAWSPGEGSAPSAEGGPGSWGPGDGSAPSAEGAGAWRGGDGSVSPANGAGAWRGGDGSVSPANGAGPGAWGANGAPAGPATWGGDGAAAQDNTGYAAWGAAADGAVAPPGARPSPRGRDPRPGGPPEGGWGAGDPGAPPPGSGPPGWSADPNGAPNARGGNPGGAMPTRGGNADGAAPTWSDDPGQTPRSGAEPAGARRGGPVTPWGPNSETDPEMPEAADEPEPSSRNGRAAGPRKRQRPDPRRPTNPPDIAHTPDSDAAFVNGGAVYSDPYRPRQEPAEEASDAEATHRIGDRRRREPPRRRPDRTAMLDPGQTGPIAPRPLTDDGGPSTAVGLAPAGAEDWHRDRTARRGAWNAGQPADGSAPFHLDDDEQDEYGDGDHRRETERVSYLDRPADDLDDPDDHPAGLPAEPRSRSATASTGQAWAAVVAQWIAGAIGGAALWVGFRFLWRDLPVVALAAAVLVTVGLVLVVRALMHNDDRRTTLFAVLVGLLLTVSPAILVLLGR